jgi:6-pyruvoyltetrahydropterin/6-carboxytetrahydropterin synthase
VYNTAHSNIKDEEHPVSRIAVAEIQKEELRFSAGHFMIYSLDRRETVHGHDYQVAVTFHTRIDSNGLSFDLRDSKQKLSVFCEKIDYHLMLPSESEFLRLEETADHWVAHLGNEQIFFLKKDAVVLPICNATLEEISNWFLQQLLQNAAELKADKIQGLVVKVFNGRNEMGASAWGNLQQY